MRRSILVLLLASFPLLAAEPRNPHDVTTYPVVWSIPEADRIAPRTGIRYGSGDLLLDLYLPRDAKGKVPVVIFANVTGIDFREWEIYRSWARLVAAHGMAGVVYQGGRDAAAKKSLDAVLSHLAKRGATYGIDPARIGVWACSANVSLALPWLMDGAPANVRAGVLYYGDGAAPKLRTDLPVLYVLAGRDAPQMNDAIRGLFTRAAREGAPWEMVVAPTLTHAFDALDEGTESRRRVKETVAWLVDRLVAPPAAGPAPSPARAALTHAFGREPAEAAEGYRAILKGDPKDEDARRALRRILYNWACAEALAGRKDAALDRLGEAVDEGFGPRDFIEKDEDLVSLRGDPRFAAILDRVKTGG